MFENLFGKTGTAQTPDKTKKGKFEGLFSTTTIKAPVVSNVKTITLPDGGAFKVDLGDISKNPVLTTREYAGLTAQPDAQRDHIIAVALGGISDPSNLQMQYGVAKDYKDKVEKYYINQYKSGKVNLNEAVVKIKNWDNEDIPTQKAYNKVKMTQAIGGGLMTPTEARNLLMDRLAQTSIGKKVLEWAAGKQTKIEDTIKQEIEVAKEQSERGVIGSFMEAGKAAIEAPKQAVLNYRDSADNFWETWLSNSTKAEKLSASAQTIVGGAGVLLSPITAVFSAAEEVPATRQAAQLVGLPFVALGSTASFVSDIFISGLQKAGVIDQTTADTLKPAFGQLASTTAQIILGAKVMNSLNVGVKNAKDVFKSSDVLTTEQIRKMAKEAEATAKAQETAKPQVVEPPKAKLTIPEQKVMDLRNNFLSLKQVGKQLGYTVEKVRQLEAKATTKLGETGLEGGAYQVGITSVKGREVQVSDKLVEMAKKMESKGNYKGATIFYFKSLDSGIKTIKNTLPSEGVLITKISKSFGRYFGETEPTIYLKVNVNAGSLKNFVNGIVDLADKSFKQNSVIIHKWIDKNANLGIIDEGKGLSYEPAFEILFNKKITLKDAKVLDELFNKNNLAGATIKPDGSGIEVMNLSAYGKNYEQFTTNATNLISDLRDRGYYRSSKSGVKEVRHIGVQGQGLTTYERIRSGIETTPETGYGKTAKVALSIQAKAIENGFIKKGYQELAKFDPVTVLDQTNRTAELMRTDIARAKRIALGQETPPEGVRPIMVFSAVEDYAMAVRDGALVRELAKSPVATEVSLSAQTLRLAGERTPDSAVAKIQELQATRERVAQRKMEGKSPDEARLELKKQLVEKVKKAKTSKYNWQAFLDEIKC